MISIGIINSQCTKRQPKWIQTTQMILLQCAVLEGPLDQLKPRGDDKLFITCLDFPRTQKNLVMYPLSLGPFTILNRYRRMVQIAIESKKTTTNANPYPITKTYRNQLRPHNYPLGDDTWHLKIRHLRRLYLGKSSHGRCSIVPLPLQEGS